MGGGQFRTFTLSGCISQTMHFLWHAEGKFAPLKSPPNNPAQTPARVGSQNHSTSVGGQIGGSHAHQHS